MMSHSGREVTLEQLFRDKSLAIDENEFSNTWLVDIPNLAEECTNTTLVSLVGETIEISGEVYHVNREETFEELSKLLTPRFLRDAFPVTSASGQISRILLRREFIQRWNAQVGSLGSADIDRYPKQIVLCAAVGMGKSIDLYLTAVFARHCKLIVQYFADPSSLLEYEIEEELYEWFLKMILFMNAESLDLVDWRLSSSDEDKKHLNGLSLKCLIFYALKKKEFRFCSFVRKELINLQFPNMIIVDEHDGLWIEFSDYSPEWPKFFKFYSNIADMRSVRTCFVGVILRNDIFLRTIVVFLLLSHVIIRFQMVCGIDVMNSSGIWSL